MPATISSGRSGRRRRTMSEINMVPFIDVMLVLLIIFMVSAPLIAASVIDLPTVGAAQQRPAQVVEIVVGADERLRVRVDGGHEESIALAQLVARVQQLQGGDASVPVVISADRQVRYEAVVRVMDRLQRAGVQRVGLAVRQSP
jgi:biopolymer transport protein TolR